MALIIRHLGTSKSLGTWQTKPRTTPYAYEPEPLAKRRYRLDHSHWNTYQPIDQSHKNADHCFGSSTLATWFRASYFSWWLSSCRESQLNGGVNDTSMFYDAAQWALVEMAITNPVNNNRRRLGERRRLNGSWLFRVWTVLCPVRDGLHQAGTSPCSSLGRNHHPLTTCCLSTICSCWCSS
jgi:hypothetical protein